MHEYYTYSKVPESKKYIQVNIIDFKNYSTSNFGEDLTERLLKYMRNHHCNFYRNDAMFVYENFMGACGEDDDVSFFEYCTNSEKFSDDDCNATKIWFILRDFLRSYGYVTYKTGNEWFDAERSCGFPDYDGILFDCSW